MTIKQNGFDATPSILLLACIILAFVFSMIDGWFNRDWIKPIPEPTHIYVVGEHCGMAGANLDSLTYKWND